MLSAGLNAQAVRLPAGTARADPMSDDARTWVLHVDLDQFIAAVEVLRRPELAGKPVIVGGRGDPTERAVVSTASYEAREFGVGSGMPLRIAARKVPDAVILPVDAAAYTAASDEVMATLRDQPGAVVQVLGWDEAFIGVDTDDPEAYARAIQRAVLDADRPALQRRDRRHARAREGRDGVRQAAGRVPSHRRQLARSDGHRPTIELWGVGTKISRRLAGLGIRTVPELATADRDALVAEFGPKMGLWYRQLGRGDGSSVVDDTPWVARGHGRETTYQQDLTEPAQIDDAARELLTQVLDDVAAEGRPVVGLTPEGALRAVLHEDLHQEDPDARSIPTWCSRSSWSSSRGSSPTVRSGCWAFAPRWRCRTTRARGIPPRAAAGSVAAAARRPPQRLPGVGLGGLTARAGEQLVERPQVVLVQTDVQRRDGRLRAVRPFGDR